MSDFPNGWCYSNLGEVCDKGQYGWTTKSSDIGHVKFLRTTDITQGAINWETVPFCEESPSDLAKYLINPNDILISRAGSVGFSALIPSNVSKAVFASYLIRFVPSQEIEPRYIAQFLRSNQYWKQISVAANGIALANINATKLADVRLPLAPYYEQKRITDKLDTVLARVDACRDHLDRIPAILKRFRQSVLAAATSGNLTKEWREQNSNTPSHWSSSTLGSLIQRIEAGLNVKCDERPPEIGEIGLVKISAVSWGVFNDDESKTLPSGTVLPDSTRIKVGDFLISRANTLELVGACVLVENVKRPVYLPDKVLRLVLSEEIKPWLLYVLRSDIGRHQIETLASGNQLSMRNLSQANLKSIQIPMPEMEERNEIVRRVESLLAYADRLEARYKAASAQVEKLTPSLLAKAFRGELVPQDPNDEPASALLARIAAVRSTDKPVKVRKSSRGKTARVSQEGRDE